MRRDNPEQRLQIQVANYLRVALKPPTLWTAFPAGGGGKVRGAFLKRMGLQAGWPDILIFCPSWARPNLPPVIGLELKAENGRKSPSQLTVSQQFFDAGFIYYIARSVDEVEGFLRGLGIPLNASVGVTARAAA